MRIFVARLSRTTEEDELKTLFEKYGTVNEVHLVRDRDTGQSKRYGIVEMEDDYEGDEAIDALNGAEVDGYHIHVSEGQSKYGRGGRGDGGGRNRGGGGGRSPRDGRSYHPRYRGYGERD